MNNYRTGLGQAPRRILTWASGILLLLSTPAFATDPTDTWLWIQDPWSGESVFTRVPQPDTSLWNAKRIDDYEKSLEAPLAPPLGILTIDRLNLEVPIFNGTDDVTLDRGAGRIKGMARMNEDGNLGISGHRDGYFRVL